MSSSLCSSGICYPGGLLRQLQGTDRPEGQQHQPWPFGDMEKDFRAAPKLFWKTVRHLRRGKQGTIQAVYSKDGTLLTSTDGVLGRWKEHFEELLNPTTPPSMVEAELEYDGGSTPISRGEVTEVVSPTVAKPRGWTSTARNAEGSGC